ncbi:HalOD1 output domain-containing protein [Natrinema sp. SYSU A 869]|uniref:HalOD1 output domain-containing protein n=1 Tax=Natrinema sp. SYSU A 869 TaxID=2871694 RepID=UPI001CA460AA|nr:HalOD1 output domain-containing protein [Natrinema sp. SYSU A 869]
MQPNQSLSLKIVDKVAEREGVQPEELNPPIHYAINTDALDSLYEASNSDRNPSKVEFVYKGYTVTVDSTGDVDIENRVATLDPEKTAV